MRALETLGGGGDTRVMARLLVWRGRERHHKSHDPTPAKTQTRVAEDAPENTNQIRAR